MLPDALKGLKLARFNPMDILDPASQSFHAMCDKLAAALVWDEGREGMHFTTAARMLVSGVIAALMRHGAAHEKNLVAVARSSAETFTGSAVSPCNRPTTLSSSKSSGASPLWGRSDP